jgi:hypothetical protein
MFEETITLLLCSNAYKLLGSHIYFYTSLYAFECSKDLLVSDLSSPCKLLALTWNVEEWVPPAEKHIFKFHSKEDLKKWHLYSDSEYGGTYADRFKHLLRKEYLILFLLSLSLSFPCLGDPYEQL